MWYYIKMWKGMNNFEIQKKKKASTKTCPYCRATFTQKHNWDRHIKRLHQEDVVTFVENATEAMEITYECEDNNN